MDPTKTRFVLSLHHQEVDQYDDAAAVWVEISGNQSKACVVESRQMSGLHSNVAAVRMFIQISVSYTKNIQNSYIAI